MRVWILNGNAKAIVRHPFVKALGKWLTVFVILLPVSFSSATEPVSGTRVKTCHDHLSPEQRHYAQLAAYDAETWTKYVDKTLFNEGENIEKFYFTVLPLLSGMPIELQDQVLKTIGKNYAQAEKKNAEMRAWLGENLFMPKRCYDFIIRVLIAPEKIISQGIAKGLSTLDAYDLYLAEVAQVIEPSGRPIYNATVVLSALQAAQRWYREVNSRLFKRRSVTIFGSFPMGRSDLRLKPSNSNIKPLERGRSDLDFFINWKLAWTANGRIVLRDKLISAVNEAIRPFLKRDDVELNDGKAAPVSESFLLQLSPIYFTINHSEIRMFVLSYNPKDRTGVTVTSQVLPSAP